MHRAVPENVDRLWDVLIIGAGVAGAMAAHGAAKMGLSVVMIDKAAFPRGKACGCCLNPAAVRLLDECGLDIRTLGARTVEYFHIACNGTTAKIPTPGGLAVSREVLDMALIGHAEKAGAVFLPRTAAFSTLALPAYRTVDVRQEDMTASLRAKIVLVADGLGGRMLRSDGELEIASRSRVGIAGTLKNPTDYYRPGIIHMACGKRGYAGLVIVEDGNLHIAAALDVHAARDASGGSRAVAGIIREAGWPVPAGLDSCRWHGAPALTRRRKKLFDHRLFVLGDAAGYVEPFSGEGMAWALAGAHDVLPIIDRAVQFWRADLGPQWQAHHRQLIGSRQRACRVVTRLLRNQGLTRVAVEAMKLSPALAAPLVRHINRPFAAV